MVAPTSPALLKRWIGLNLRQLRKEAGKGRPEVANRLGISRTSVGHLETARNLPSPAVLEILLDFYGTPERLPDFSKLIEAARKGRNWWEHLAGVVPSWFDLYLGLEAGAAELSIFDSYLVPGLLQTADYAEAVFRSDGDLTEEQIRQRVELRQGRQDVLEQGADNEQARVCAVLDESVLLRQRGTPEVMAQQLDRLLEMSEQPRVELLVLPLNAGAHVAQQGSFQILKFPSEFVGDPGVVYLELLVEGRYYEDPDDIALYERAMNDLRVRASTPEESRTILHRAMKEVRP